MGEVSISSPCPGCGAAVHDDAAFCHACGKPLSRAAGVRRVLDGAIDGVEGGLRTVMKRPSAQKLAAGALLGAGAAVVVPFVTMGVGATLGAGYAAWRLLKKD